MVTRSATGPPMAAGERPANSPWAPDHPVYSSLRFGPGEKNLLAVRTRGFDKRFGGLSDEVLKHYVYEPVWADQVISVGPPYLEIADLEVQQIQQQGPDKVIFALQSPGAWRSSHSLL